MAANRAVAVKISATDAYPNVIISVNSGLTYSKTGVAVVGFTGGEYILTTSDGVTYATNDADGHPTKRLV